MPQKLVSVIMPVFNDSEICKKGIFSVLNQTYHNIELIIVDDNSEDFLSLNSYVSSLNDSRVTLLKHEENKNAATARNTGAKNAKGEILSFIDSDDYWAPTKIERQVEVLKNKSVVCCRSYVDQLSETGASNIYKKNDYYAPQATISNLLFGRPKNSLLLQTSTLLLNKRDFFSIGGFNEDLRRHQDYQLLLDLQMNGLNILLVDDWLSYYVKRNSRKTALRWHISYSEIFLSLYKSKLTNDELYNFLVCQLLWPSIKARCFKRWLTLSYQYQVPAIYLALKVTHYLWNKITDK